MIGKKGFILLFICSAALCFAQKQTNFWYFGTNAGLDFNSGAPVVMTNGTLSTTEGCSAMSDASGNLLFYTDGRFVYNKNHVQMPNGSGLFGDISTTQSALIIAKPGSTTLYYIFTLAEEGGGNFCYSVVDMTLDGGNGDVTTKNTVLAGNITEKLCAVKHCNGTDVWVMIHLWNSNTFQAYQVTSTGINAPVISSIGGVHADVHGQMKFNNSGTQLAVIRDTVIAGTADVNDRAYLDILNFNNNTGVLSGFKTAKINNYQRAYGVEFSPDDSKVYASYYNSAGATGGNTWLVQFDPLASNLGASAAVISTANDIYRALQLASDGKIYLCKNFSPLLGVINSPNLAGAACSFTDNAINLDPSSSTGASAALGLPGFMQSYFNPSFPNIPCTAAPTASYSSSDTTFCTNTCINFNDLSFGTPTSWNWTFAGATPSVSSVQNPSMICYPSAGTYSVRLIVSNGSANDTISRNVIVTGPTLTAGPDFTIAPGSSVTLLANTNASTYTWSPLSTLTNTNTLNPVANPTITTVYVLHGKDANNCVATDSVKVIVLNDTTCGELFIPTAFSPNNDGQNDMQCVLGSCIAELIFVIYDRWGEKVFETNDKNLCWNGEYKGKLMNSGIYVYHVVATLSNGETVNKKGNLHLIR